MVADTPASKGHPRECGRDFPPHPFTFPSPNYKEVNMRTRNNSLLTALILLSLVVGAIGCKSNGGPWYKPGSYAMHNPFKAKDEPLSSPYPDRTATTKPSMGAQPNVATPPGGYATKELQVQYNNTPTGGATPEANRLARSEPAVSGGNIPTSGYSDPGYNPNVAAYNPNMGTSYPGTYPPNSGVTPQNIQPTSIATPYGPSYTPQGTPDYASNPGTPLPWGAQAPYDPAPASGFTAPVNPTYETAPGGFPSATPVPYGTQPVGGFDAPVNSYGSAVPSYGGTGYTANPSTTSGYGY